MEKTESFEEQIDNLRVENKSLKKQLIHIESILTSITERNYRVELNKRWETSTTRFLCVALITYIIMNLILWTINGPNPPIHAIVPTCGYMLSTLSLRKVKELWMVFNKLREKSRN